MQDFDMIHTKGGEAKIRVPVVLELKMDIEEGRRFSQRCEESRVFGEPVDWSKELPSAADVLELNLMEAECNFREFAWKTADFIEEKLIDARESLEDEACICDECRERLEQSFLASE